MAAALTFGFPMRALRIQAHVTAALVLREIKTRFGAMGAGWIWLLSEPMLQGLAYVALYEFLRSRVSPLRGVDVAEFMLSGIIPWLFYGRTSQQVMHSIEGNRSLLVYPQVTPLDIAIARTILEAMIMYVVIAFFLALRWFAMGEVTIGDPLGLMLSCAALALMGFGVGLCAMSFGHFVPGLMLVFSYVNRMLYFTSGIFFTIAAVPATYRGYIDWNPLLHAVEWARASYLDTAETDLLNFPLLAFSVPMLVALGVFAERATRSEGKKVSTS